MTLALEVNHVSKAYQDFMIEDLSFSVPKGYIMGLIGPNGAGKSTTIKMILNLVKKDRGSIKIFGFDHIEHEIKVRERIGMVFDENHFYEDLTCAQVKKIIARFYKNWDERIYHNYMKQFQLPHDKKVKELSKGMKMKFAIAMALSHHAELIIMDEPTAGLDPIVRSEVLDILQEIVLDENKSVLFSTHITTDLEKIADYLTFIHDGQVVFSEAKDDVLEHYWLVKGDDSLLDQDRRHLFVGIRKSDYGFVGLTRDVEQVRGSLKNSVIYEKPSLEEIMIYTVKKG
ncbi:ABC transporter ATP-binding protein [Thermoflavimicrobium daqui]|jgi:ABC-2 type transport system ATP-binding protein|uniref:Sodium ABC transporter ATP-binding protein n=1 Tax=Thermoflavimicrobium daqui TaxID=2137476 RepID=A0A364K725_9BACL|nr:ABC transporter ATP-binding protein [Thermoflavimicrobium daqui]RAL26106.1 sodium ABC transporter ATP-binding protein [Thermoflavimicrobium daqui]